MILVLILLSALVVAAVTAYAAFSWGYVLFLFWGWFILPIFPQAPELLYLHAVGLTFIVALFKSSGYTEPDKVRDMRTSNEKTTNAILDILKPWITLALGGLVHLLIS